MCWVFLDLCCWSESWVLWESLVWSGHAASFIQNTYKTILESVTGKDIVAVVDSPIGRLGLTVCYDLRFPELYQQLRFRHDVLEINDDFVKMRQATTQVLTSQKRLENKYKAAEEASENWYHKAQLALQKG